MKIRPGTCSTCQASYRMPADFPASKARCRSCGGVVEIGAAIEELPPPVVTPPAASSAPMSTPPTPATAKPSVPTAAAPSAPAASAPSAPAAVPAAPTPAAAKPEAPKATPPVAAAPAAPLVVTPAPAPAPAAATPPPSAPPKATPPAEAAPSAPKKEFDSLRPRSRKPQVNEPKKRELLSFGGKPPAPAPQSESKPSAPAAKEESKTPPPKQAETKPVAKQTPPPAQPAKPPAPEKKASEKPTAPAKSSAQEPATPPAKSSAPAKATQPTNATAPTKVSTPAKPEAPARTSSLDAIMERKREQSRSPLENAIKKNASKDPVAEKAASAPKQTPAKADLQSEGRSSTLDKILARKRSETEEAMPAASKPIVSKDSPKTPNAKVPAKSDHAAAAKSSGSSTLEKILARKRAEADEIVEIEEPPTRKAVWKANAPASDPRAAKKATAAPSRSASKSAPSNERGRGRGKDGGKNRDRDEEREQRRAALEGKKKSNALLYGTLGVIVLAGGAVGLNMLLDKKEEKAPTPPPPVVTAAVEQPKVEEPVVAESTPVEASAEEQGTPKEAAAKKEDDEPKAPTASRKFDAQRRDALAAVDAPAPSPELQEWITEVSQYVISGFKLADFNNALAAEPRAAFGALHNQMVAIAKERFTPQVTLDSRGSIDSAVEIFYRLSTQMSAISGYSFSDDEEKKMGSMRSAVAGYDPETEATKILDEQIRVQNACLAHLVRWSELWEQKKLATVDGWNDFVGENGRGSREKS